MYWGNPHAVSRHSPIIVLGFIIIFSPAFNTQDYVFGCSSSSSRIAESFFFDTELQLKSLKKILIA